MGTCRTTGIVSILVCVLVYFLLYSDELKLLRAKWNRSEKLHAGNGRIITFGGNVVGTVKSSKRTLFLGILSKTEHRHLRDVHRKFLKIKDNLPLNVVIRFLLDRETPQLTHEAQENEDIVFLNTESLGPGTKLGVKFYKWIKFVSENCPEANLVGKMDDDVFLCTDKMFERLENVLHPRLYYGWQHKGVRGTLRKFGEEPFRHIELRMDEMFVIIGRTLVDRILGRRPCFVHNQTCESLKDLIDTDFADESLALWLSVYPDVIEVRDNKKLVHYPKSSIAPFLKPGFCSGYQLLHPLKSPKDLTKMYINNGS